VTLKLHETMLLGLFDELKLEARVGTTAFALIWSDSHGNIDFTAIVRIYRVAVESITVINVPVKQITALLC